VILDDRISLKDLRKCSCAITRLNLAPLLEKKVKRKFPLVPKTTNYVGSFYGFYIGLRKTMVV